MQKVYPKLILPINEDYQPQLVPKTILDQFEIAIIEANFSELPRAVFPIFKSEQQLDIYSNQAKGFYIEQVNSESTLKQQITSLKKKYPDLILGVNVNNSYDTAMLAGDLGADFISFEYNKSTDFDNFLYLLETWSSYTIIQSMLVADQLNEKQLKLCLEKGIDFIHLPKSFWKTNSIVEKIENLNNLLNQYPYTTINFDKE